ncbi:hypothetical protein CSC94_23045 [Zhengella mangrovi]|uniref:Uncharacterized protein n=2 Tax=Zhengella mangrovi TaxID=1982044 RepID=A0A2G1QGQ4_9HYPH|nr:hypothetical protein CSC94_23045 [Zhengella mangrovi]
MPIVETHKTEVGDILACIKKSGAINGIRFAVALWADGTGQTNAVADGMTGTKLPQGTSATYVSGAIRDAGGIALNRYENNTNASLANFGGAPVQEAIAKSIQRDYPHYVVTGMFTSLDFTGGKTVDVRVAGVGPMANTRAARVGFSTELVTPGSGRLVADSKMSRVMRFKEIGIGGGIIIGNTLATGQVMKSDQQMLQAESLEDPISLMVADLILQSFPKAQSACGSQFGKLMPSA